jgi:hypothetical protein
MGCVEGSGVPVLYIGRRVPRSHGLLLSSRHSVVSAHCKPKRFSCNVNSGHLKVRYVTLLTL